MPSILSKFVAIFVTVLLAAGAIVATPLAANAATDSSVTVSFVDGDGEPVSGVNVYRYYFSPAGNYDSGSSPYLAESTESPGSFVVDGMDSDQRSRAYLSVYGQGYQSGNFYISLSDGDVTLTLQKLAISGTVTDHATGDVLTTGTVQLYDGSSSALLATTSLVDGKYSFSIDYANYYIVRFSAPGYTSELQNDQFDDVAGGQSIYVYGPQQLDAQLVAIPSYTLSGSYIQNYNSPDAHVYFERLDGDVFSLAASASMGGAYDLAYSVQLTPGYYRVTAIAAGAKISKRFVTITNSDVSMTPIALSTNTNYGYLQFTTPHADPTNPVKAIYYQEVTPGNWQVVPTFSYQQGTYLYTAITSGVTYRVALMDPSDTYKTRTFAPDGTYTDDAVTLADVAALPNSYNFTNSPYLFNDAAAALATKTPLSTGTFEYFGQPVAGAVVTFWSHTDGFDIVKSTLTDSTGAYAAFLPAGTYTVSATANGYADVPLDSHNTVTIDEGSAADFGTREFTHATDTTLSGSVVDQFGNPYSTTVTLQQLTDDVWADADTDPQSTDENGNYSFPVSGGTYRVIVGQFTSASYSIDPSIVVPTIVIDDPDVTTPADPDNLPALSDAKVGLEASVPAIDWTDGWSTGSVKWYVDDELVGSDDTYTPTAAQLGGSLSAVVTGVRGDLTYDVTLTGVEIAGNTFDEAPVSISGAEGALHVGDILTADAQWGTDGVTESWSWSRGETAIGTDSNTYTVTEADLNSTLSVTVHAEKDGYESADHTGSVDLPKGTLDPQVTTTGDGTIGTTLTASAAGVPDDIPVTYAWHYGVDLVSSGATHVLSAADFEHGVSLVATTDETDSYEASTTVIYPDTTKLDITDGAATVSGTPEVGEQLTATVTGGPEGATVSGYWYGAAENEVDGLDYTVQPEDAGAELAFFGTISAPGYNDQTIELHPQVTDVFADSGVAISGAEGNLSVGDVLTADAQWGTDGVTETWDWSRGETAIGTDSNTYTVTEADLNSTLSVTVHGEKDGYESADHTGSVDLPKGTLDTQITTTGAGTIGTTLTASVSGVPEGIPVTYTWYTGNGSDSLSKLKASKASKSKSTLRAVVQDESAGTTTGATHVLTADDFEYGLYLVASTEETDLYRGSNSGTWPELTSLDFTTAVAAVVSGTLAVGQELTATVTGAPDGASINAYWYGSDSETDGLTYTVQPGDVGRDIEFDAYVWAPGYNGQWVSAYPHITGAVQKPGTATISGTPAVGEWLEANVTDWVEPTQLDDQEYAWFIDDERVQWGDEYQVQPSDRGKTITFRATGYAEGYDAGVAEATVDVPLDTFTAGTPTMAGANALGSVLTASAGSWGAGVKLDTQWLRNGVVIPGETGATHTVVAADQGTVLAFRVTASRPNYATQIVSVTASIPAAAVADAPPTVVEKIVTVIQTVTVHTFGSTPAPKVSGKAKVGKTLTAKASWSPGATFTYKWFANGKAIPGATKSSLKIAASVKGKKITVTVTGTKAGYQTVSATSKATAKVAK